MISIVEFKQNLANMEIDKKHIVNLVRYVLSEVRPINGIMDLNRAENIVDNYLEDINYSHCCKSDSEQLQGFFDYYKQKFGGGFNTDVLEITLQQYKETL